ncbi:MAG: serine/threonine-protein kinase [Gemmatimonadaceae bacterium]
MTFLDDAALERLRCAADAPDLSGTKYAITRELARGGMGTVYEAWDAELERAVALKVVTVPEAIPEGVARLHREARTLAHLEHPGIVPVHDIGRLPDGRFYYAMKLVRGARLDELVATAPRAELLRIFGRVCDAIAFAHAHGVVHRDIKPANIMVAGFGEVLVVDWGLATEKQSPVDGRQSSTPNPASEPSSEIAARADDDTRLATADIRPVTGHGAILGTPGFMAPEQSSGGIVAVDARADVFALGALLQWMLGASGRAAPRANALAAIAGQAMRADPAARYQSVTALAADVEAFLDKRPVSAYPERALERARRVVTKYRAPIVLVLAYLVMRLVLLLVMRERR